MIKLNVYGIRCIVNKCFASYLRDRSKFVDIDSNISSSKSITCGDPHASIITWLRLCFFTTLTLVACMGKPINYFLHTWFCVNKLPLNAKKLYILFLYVYLKELLSPTLIMNRVSVELIGNNCVVNSIKYIKICLEDNLTWKHHSAHVDSKCHRHCFR